MEDTFDILMGRIIHDLIAYDKNYRFPAYVKCLKICLSTKHDYSL